MGFREGTYLEKHLEEPASAEQELVVSKGVDQPLVEGAVVDYASEAEIHIGNSDISLDFSVKPLTSEQIELRRGDLVESFNKAKSENVRALIKKQMQFFSSPSYALRTFRLSNNQTDLNIGYILEDRSIGVIVNPKQEIEANSYNFGEIWVSGEINNLGTVLALLHEVSGHKHDGSNVSGGAVERYLNREKITSSEGKAILKSERNAWAYALNKIKPFLSKEQKLTVRDFIHKYCLSYYSQNIRNQLAPTWKLIIPQLIEIFDGKSD